MAAKRDSIAAVYKAILSFILEKDVKNYRYEHRLKVVGDEIRVALKRTRKRGR